MVLKSFLDKVVPEQRVEESEGVVFLSGKEPFPGEGARGAMALRCGVGLVCWGNHEGVSVQGGVNWGEKVAWSDSPHEVGI